MASSSTIPRCPVNHILSNKPKKILSIWITGIVQFTKRSGRNKSSLIDIDNIMHLITKSIDKDSNSICHDDSSLELPNKSS